MHPSILITSHSHPNNSENIRDINQLISSYLILAHLIHLATASIVNNVCSFRVNCVQRIACDAGATDGAAGLPRACARRPLPRTAAARAACARDGRASRGRRDLRERSRSECGSCGCGGGTSALARTRRTGLRDAQAALQRDARARALHALGA